MVIAAEGENTQARTMYRTYAAWVDARKLSPLAEKAFAQRMIDLGYVRTPGRVREYLNVIVADDCAPTTKA